MTAWWLAPASARSLKVPFVPRRITGGSGTGTALNACPARSAATMRGTSGIRLSGRARTSARG